MSHLHYFNTAFTDQFSIPLYQKKNKVCKLCCMPSLTDSNTMPTACLFLFLYIGGRYPGGGGGLNPGGGGRNPGGGGRKPGGGGG